MNKQFQRKIENFSCMQCGTQVQGDGYTNHCPTCLWSRHVDLQPGDREADCGGMMESIELDGKVGEYRILHKCQLCGLESWNRSAKNDDFDTLLSLARERGAPK